MVCCLGVAGADDAGWPMPQGMAEAPPTLRCPQSAKGDTITPYVIRRVPLDDVAFFAKAGALPDTVVRFAPNGRDLAIGTFLGRVKVIDVYSGDERWNQKVAEGIVKTVDFSPDGATLFYGEQSVDGFVYAADARSGEVKWRFRLADELDSSPPPEKGDPWGVYQLPACFRVKALQDGGALVLGLHAWSGDYMKPETQTRWSRLYRLDRDGNVVWAFPKDGPMPITLIYFDADSAARRVAVLASDKGANAPADCPYPERALHVLDGASGVPIGTHRFVPLVPYFETVWFWHSVSVSADAQYASVGLQDGRSYVFDLGIVKPIREFTFGAPVMMGDVPVAAEATYTRCSPDGMVYFQTGNSSVPAAIRRLKVTAPPGPHPNANTINAVDAEGKVVWRYRSGHHYQNFWTSADGRWLISSVEKESDEAGRDAGVILFDTHRHGGGSSKFVYYYQVAGRCFFNADISPDGAAIALVEVPYVDPQSNMLAGTYQVHVVR